MKRCFSNFSYIDNKGYLQEVVAYNINKETENYCEFEIVIKGKSFKMVYLFYWNLYICGFFDILDEPNQIG